MKKGIIFLATCAIMTLTACEKDRVSGAGNIVTEQRAVTNFTRVNSSGSNNVHISQGADFRVSVKGYENLIPFFETKLVNGELQLGYKNNTSVKNDNVEVFVTMPSLNGASVSGSSSIDVHSDFGTSSALNASVSGSGTISFGPMEPQDFNAQISGSGKIFAFEVMTNKATIDISGSGELEVSVASELEARISGSGNVYYKGNPVVNASISGSGKVLQR